MQNEDLKPVVKITGEQAAKVAAAKTPEDMLALAKEEGVTLTDEQLENVSGGVSWAEVKGGFALCPDCNSWSLKYEGNFNGVNKYSCTKCGNWCKGD